jgi:hypothetical protein
MPKVFYTEKDIEDLARSGQMTLEVTDNVALTDLAYEKARRLGVRLVTGAAENPPAAPVRPYLSQKSDVRPVSPVTAESSSPPVPAVGVSRAELSQRIRSAVLAKLGSQVDPELLDVIIRRVLDSTGVH